MIKLAEIFRSRQGEGLLTGVPSVFVRTSGCNLRCWFCDTRYASWAPEGDAHSLPEIVAEVDRLAAPNAVAVDGGAEPCRHVVLTGGEPMLFHELPELAAALRASGYHVTIETAGTVDQPVEADLMSISPKFANSAPDRAELPRWSAKHESRRFAPDVLNRLINDYEHQVKFVIDAPEDLADVEAFLTRFPQVNPDRVLLMPQGVDVAELAAREAWIQPFALSRGYVYCPRKHIEWYGAVRGT